MQDYYAGEEEPIFEKYNELNSLIYGFVLKHERNSNHHKA